MLETIKDGNNNIQAVLEWWLVDKWGNFDKNGLYIWIADAEINPDQRMNGLLKKFVKMVSDRAPNAKYAYFTREGKYPKRSPRMYSRRRWLQLLKEE